MSAPSTLNRREFLQTTTTAAVGFATFSSNHAAAAPGAKDDRSTGIIDTNVTLGRWPFRRLPLDEQPALVAKLREYGVTQAWACSFDVLVHKDMAAANARLAGDCRKRGRGLLVPFGSVNPKLPDWEEDLRLCQEVHKMPGLRLYPNYHGYPLDDPAFSKLLALAAQSGLMVQIAVSMEDERMQAPLARVPHVDVKPLFALLKTLSGLRIELLNWHRAVNAGQATQLAALGVCFDIATVEGVGGVANLIGQIGDSRVLFGSDAPLFYFESALLKLRESALDEEHSRAVRLENARRLCSTGKAG